MQASPAVKDVMTDELREGLRDGTILVVDVREPHEQAAGVIPGSILRPLSAFDPADLPKAEGRRIVFSCAAGVRSLIALEACRRAGLAHSEHFRPGFKGWVAAGGPVEEPPP